MSDDEFQFVPLEEIDELEDTVKLKKQRKKLFENAPPKRRTLYMCLIFIGSSGLLSLLFGVALHFTPIINKAKTGVLSWLPGNFIAEMMIIWALIIITFFVFLPLIPYISKLYIHSHRLIKYFRFEYGIVKTDEHYFSFKEALARVMIPFLFSFIVGYWLANWTFLSGLPYNSVNTLVYLLFSFLLMPITILLITPLWLLDDAGIIAMKKRKDGDRKIPDIEGPTVFFNDFYTGSSYTLAIVTFIDFFRNIFSNFEVDVFITFWIALLLLLPLGILTIIFLYENFMRRLKPKLHKILPQKLVDMTPKILVDSPQPLNDYQSVGVAESDIKIPDFE